MCGYLRISMWILDVAAAAHELDITRNEIKSANYIRQVNPRLGTDGNYRSIQKGLLVLQRKVLAHFVAKLDTVSPEQSLRKAKHQGDLMTNLIDRLLDVSSISSGKLELDLTVQDLGKIVFDIVEKLTGKAREAGCGFHLRIEEGLETKCDRPRLEQAVGNVISNALKSAPGSGRPISVSLERIRSEAVLTVDAGGVGINPDDQACVFTHSEQTASSPEFGASALGLYITQEIVTLHGGSTCAERRGCGSRLVIKLPLSTKEQSVLPFQLHFGLPTGRTHFAK